MISTRRVIAGKFLTILLLLVALVAWVNAYDYSCELPTHFALSLVGGISAMLAGLVTGLTWLLSVHWYGSENETSCFSSLDPTLRANGFLVPVRPTRYDLRSEEYELLKRRVVTPSYRDICLRIFSKYFDPACWVVIVLVLGATQFGCVLSSTYPSKYRIEMLVAYPAFRIVLDSLMIFGLYQACVNAWLVIFLKLRLFERGKQR